MELSDRLYKAYVEEMQALEGLRRAWAAERPGSGLGREDPDVRRLLEAIGLLSARSRLASESSVSAARRRVLRQLVPYLLHPLPSVAMVEATPNGKLAEPVVLSAGTSFEIRPTGGAAALFSLPADVRVLPIRLTRCEQLPLPSGQTRLGLVFEANHSRNDDVGRLPLYVDYLDDTFAAAAAMGALRQHVLRASVLVDEPLALDASGIECAVEFGCPDHILQSLWSHPVMQERFFFHAPHLDNFLHFDVPPFRKAWRRFTIILDVGPNWPRELRLSPQILRPFAFPVANVQRGMSQPWQHDGTTEKGEIRHPRAQGRFSLLQAHALYQVAEGGLVPLRAGALGGGSGSWELSETTLPDGRVVPCALVRLPEAYGKPVTMAIESDWYQPWFSQHTSDKLTVRPYSRVHAGIDWTILGRPVAHREAEVGGNLDSLAAVVVLQRKSKLDFGDVMTVLRGLGSVFGGPLAPVQDSLQGLKVKELPATTGRASGVRYVYEFELREHDPALKPLLDVFVRRVQRVLGAWIAEHEVEVRLGGSS